MIVACRNLEIFCSKSFGRKNKRFKWVPKISAGDNIAGAKI
jgi:hypothetical protein